MADMVTVQELENAKIDARTIGESVNENKIVTPRYGAPFKSMPMIAEEMQSIIGAIIGGGVPANIVADDSGLSQQQVNDNNKSALANRYTKSETDTALDLKANASDLAFKADKTDTFTKSEVAALLSPKADTSYVDSAMSNLSTIASKFYPTLAEANADIASITVNQVVNIGETENGGLWYKATAEATSLTKSAYDPLTQANNRMNANALFKPIDLVASSDLNNLSNEGYFRVKANALTMLNMPELANGVGFESVDSLGNKTQWYISQPLNNFWFRTKWNGTWKTWRKAADETQIIPITTQKTGAQTLASYKDQGIYNFAATATISDLPSDAQTGVGYTLKVENYLSGDRFKIQYLRCDSAKTGLKWERSVDKQNNTEGTWILTPRLHDGQIVPENLSASFRYKGSFASAVISDYRSDGLYTFTTPTDAPPGASSTSGLVDVKNWFSGSFVIQTWTTSTKADEIFTRLVRPTTISAWSRLGGSATSVFTDKKIAFFGDSITEFGTYPAQTSSRLSAIGFNVGFGGTRMSEHTDQWYAPFSMCNLASYVANEDWSTLMTKAEELRDRYGDDNTAIVTRLQSIGFDTVDYVPIFFGTNDFQGNVPIGIDSDATGATFKGGTNLAITRLLTRYPKLKILLVSPIWRARQVVGDGLESDTNPNSLGIYLRDYVVALQEIGKKHHIPVLDLYNNSGINPLTKNTYLSSDELHPSEEGYTHLSNLIAAKLSASY